MHREVILFYKYVDLGDQADAVAEEQRRKLAELGLTGRFRVAREGINGSCCGHADQIETYINWMESNETWRGIQYKFSRVSEEEPDPFDGEITVKLCSEITSTGPMRDAMPTALGGTGGIHLAPAAFHRLVKQAQHDRNIIVIDTRNHYETAVGSFRNAVDPKIRNFAQFPAWVEVNKDLLKGKHVAMFCTGGIRCEKASAYVNSLGIAAQVSQLEGGIHSYLEVFSPDAQKQGVKTKKLQNPQTPQQKQPPEEQDHCLFEGINFQFDNRLAKPQVGQGGDVNSYAQSRCLQCGTQWSCIRKDTVCVVCRDFVLLCETCLSHFDPIENAKLPKGAPTITARSILCFEHQLLSDTWKQRLERLQLDSKDIVRHIRALQQLNLVNAQSSRKRKRAGNKRHQLLTTQINRLHEFLQDRGYAEIEQVEEEEGEADQDKNPRTSFIPFVPCFEWNKTKQKN